MNLKDVMHNDLGVFLDVDEFADMVDIDGVTVLAVIDDSHGSVLSGARDSLANASGLGLYDNVRTLFVRDAFASRPKPGQRIVLNGEAWCVDEDDGSVAPEEGLIRLRVRRVYA